MSKPNTATLVPITINIFFFFFYLGQKKTTTENFIDVYPLIDHNVFVEDLFKGGQLGMHSTCCAVQKTHDSFISE